MTGEPLSRAAGDSHVELGAVFFGKERLMTKDELENMNAELIALLKAVRNQIDETLDALTDDDEESDDLGEFDDDEPDDED